MAERDNDSDLPFAFSGALNQQPLNPEDEQLPDDSQLESQRLDIANEPDYDDDSDEEAPNDLMIEMNPLIPQERQRVTTGSPLRLQVPTPPRRPLMMAGRDRPIVTDLRRTIFGARPRVGTTDGASTQQPRLDEEKKEAMQVWTEVENLDDFLRRVFDYYTNKGFVCMIMDRVSNLLILAFIVGFSTFLFSCVDYSQITPPQVPRKTLPDVIYPGCARNFYGVSGTFVFVFSTWWLWQFFRIILDISKLRQMKLFYEHILEIKEADMDTVTWREVVQKIGKIRNMPNSNPHDRPGLDKLDAHNIANRIMRKDNYLIALFNKDIVDFTIPCLGKRQMVTKIMEWNLTYCILNYVFDESGAVRKRFLKSTHRNRLITGLQNRIAAIAFLNLVFAPFLFVLMILYFFFRYAEEYQKNPSSLGTRQYSPFAWWKFREFNELPNLYQERLKRSYKKAQRYLEQFPKEKPIIVARFVSFISGSFAAVLAVLTLVDNQFLEFEIVKDRSVLFFIGVFGGISAVARSMIPEENQVIEPEKALREVAEDTHYLPESWRGKLHTEEVKAEFATLFDFKVVLFIQEVLSVISAPFILYYTLRKCSPTIIDFFRDFTVHVDSLGYVCSFAVFDFRTNGNVRYGAPTEGSNPHLQSKEGKMEQSFLYFKANNPDWEPDHLGSQYLQTVSRAQRFRNDGSASVDTAHSLLRPRRFVKFGQNYDGVRPVTESLLGASDADFEDQPLTLFGLLDAIYEQRRY